MADGSALKSFIPKNKVRFVTATSLYDGHDASINIMRRLLQERGAEVVHLGHNRSVREVVQAVIQEDAHAVAISSYQGGHVEYFQYIRDLLNEAGAQHVKIFGGGGGVIVPREIRHLEQYGITKIYSPEDGQRLTLPGIIGHMLSEVDRPLNEWSAGTVSAEGVLARAITLLENGVANLTDVQTRLPAAKRKDLVPVIGITGTGGAGKSSLTDELISRFLFDFPEIRIGILCVDPSKRKTGGALLGDRIRMNSASNERVYLRSLATRGSGSELAGITSDAVNLLKDQGFDFIIVETSGIGQGDAEILRIADISLYVMTPEYGASTQLEKIDMLDYADLIAVNKFERRQGPDALRDVRTQLRRSRYQGRHVSEDQYPVFGTIASRFADDGVNGLYRALVGKLNENHGSTRYEVSPRRTYSLCSSNRDALIPVERANYLGEIARSVREYHGWAKEQTDSVRRVEALEMSLEMVRTSGADAGTQATLQEIWRHESGKVDAHASSLLASWPDKAKAYESGEYVYHVRGRPIRVATTTQSLSHMPIPKVALPRFGSKAETLAFLLKENLPGEFPFAGGIYPFRRTGEDPKRQFAGEGGPARTNKRFHYLCKSDDAKRLSTAFDSVTLYGSEPHKRPDIYGKVGESGVSIATLDDMRVLYSGFDLCAPATSVSMTINGPAPILLAMFFNAAIDQRVDAFKAQHGRAPSMPEHEAIFSETLQIVRGTVQADILKEDQAQNTCIFSTEFALKMMGDIQQYFIERGVRNYYAVSISGYHIAEAGANPITQLAFTLANGLTYVEYYLARGMKIDDFAPNLSFFFSNGIDPEYSVLGRVARRIWAIAMRDRYGANERSQMLKYHIQTSGRSLHAQEIDFNDIRTTLQALMALYDNCNSLHTNAYDEAITTPTEESVRRAMAIQMIINREYGPNKCENTNQGSFFFEQLTDLVEEAVLQEFERISSRGGVLGAMETQYQRSKIQEESLYYESLKDSGELPIIGVNTYQNPATMGADYERPEIELIRASNAEKDDQLSRLNQFKSEHQRNRSEALRRLAECVLAGGNVFAELMLTVRHASLGEITECLYQVGGQYRRSM